jgi:hypothetical protein
MKHTKSLKLCGIALCAILVSSCNPNGLEPLFFSPADSDDITAAGFEYVLDAPAEKTVTKPTSKTGNGRTTVAVEWTAGGSIAAKTKVRVLARSYKMYTEGGKKGMVYLGSDYIVELPDGSRCIASLAEQGDGFRTDSLTALKKKMALYNREGRQEKVEYEEIESFIGLPLAEVERSLCPANQIDIKGGAKEAIFSNIQSQVDSTAIIKPLVLRVEEGIVTADVSPRETIERSKADSFFGKATIWLLAIPDRITGGKTLWTDSPAWKKYSWVGQKAGVPGQLTRMIISGIIALILFVAFYYWVAWRLAFKAFTYIKSLDNEAVLLLAGLLYVIMGILGIFVWTPFSLFWLLLIIPICCKAGLANEVKMERCPHCHTTGQVRYLGEDLISEKESVRNEKYKVKKGESTRMEGNTKVHIKRFEEVTDRVRKIDKLWKERLFCEACGRKITYYNRESEEKRTRIS